MAQARVGAIVVAAGSSQRMGGADKIFATVAGRPLLAHTIDALHRCPQVDQIVVVLGPDRLDEGRALVRGHGWHKVTAVCPGGARRQDSVKAGLDCLADCRWVVVHDGARPCVSEDLVSRGLEAAAESGAAIAAIPVADTIKEVSPRGAVVGTRDREGLWTVQTPQVFRIDILQEAHRTVDDTATDDAAMVERLGYTVRVYPGSSTNIKVTTPDDLAIVEAIVQQRAGRHAVTRPSRRVRDCSR